MSSSAASSLPSRDGIIAPLTGLRFIAASLVVFFHYFETVRVFDGASLPWITLLNGNGQTGVSIFFALSGFLITARYRDQWVARSISFWQYWRKRFIRIYPAYFFALVALVIVPEVLTGSTAYFNPLTVGGLLILAQAFSLALFPLGIPIGWTLTLEELYYVVAPRLARVLDSPSVGLVLLKGAGMVGLSAGIFALIVAVPASYSFTGFSEEFIYQVSLFVRLPEFIAGAVSGVVFVKLSRNREPGSSRDRATVILAPTAAVIGMILFVISNGYFLGHIWWVSAVFRFGGACCAALLMLGFGLARTPSAFGRWLGSDRIEYLGRASYALYLVHLTKPIQWLWAALHALPIHPMALVPLIFVISVAASVLLYELVERPMHARLARDKNG